MVIEELDAIGKKFSEKDNVGYNIEVKSGSVSKGVLASAKEAGADLIVMGTHGVSWIRRVLPRQKYLPRGNFFHPTGFNHSREL